MKKSKILMPLVGVAALGATVAPIVTLTSCGNKNNAGDVFSKLEYGIMAGWYDVEYMSGDLIHTYGKDFVEEAATAGKLPFVVVAKLKNNADNHKFYYSSEKVGSTGTTGTKLIWEGFEEKEIENTAEVEEYTYAGYHTLTLNADKEFKADETINFAITYSEYDKAKTEKDAKLIGKQTVKYSLTISATKLSCPYVEIVTEGLTGKATQKEVKLSGFQFEDKLTQPVTVAFTNKGTWDLAQKVEGETKNHLTIKGTETRTVGVNEQAVTFDGALSNVIPASETDGQEFLLGVDEIQLTLTADASKYVTGTWHVTFYADSDMTIKVKNA